MPTLVSQGASALSNILLLVAAGRSGAPDILGPIAAASILYQICIGSSRSIIGEVCLVRRSFLGHLDPRGAARASLVLGVTGAVPLLALGLFYPPLRCVAVLGLFMPVLLLQDTLRYVSFATKVASAAAAADIAWLMVSACLAIWSPQMSGGALGIVALWAAGAVLGVPILAPRTLRHAERQRAGWLRTSWQLGRSYLPDQLLATAGASIPPLAIGILADGAELGHLRLALASLGPVTVAWIAVANAMVPRLAARQDHDLRIEAWLSIATMIAVVAWSTVSYIVPEDFGRVIAGSAWNGARKWIPPVALSYIAFASWSGAVVGLKVHNLASSLVRVRAAVTPLLVAAPIAGFEVAGRTGYGLGGLLAGVTAGILLWTRFLRTHLDRVVRIAALGTDSPT